MDLSQFTRNGKFLMLALDHRGSFKKLISPSDPDSVLDEEVINLKSKIINSVESELSGILIDEVFGLKAYPQRSKPFLLPVEETGYTEEKGERLTKLEYTIDQLKECGASGAKLLLYFNPFLESKEKQLETAKKVIDECRQKDYPVFLEIVTYEPDHDVTGEERERLVIESLKLFKSRNILPDVFKIEYPGSSVACFTVTAILEDLPWILLTRGVNFEEFKFQLEEASVRGVKGFLAGRALWQEVCTIQSEDKDKFLKETLPNRFKIISDICTKNE